MSDPQIAAFLFASRNNPKDAKAAPNLGSNGINFSLPYKKPQQRTLRKKRHVEEYEHYAAIVFDENGCCHLLSSPSLKRQKRAILADAAARAQDVLEGTSGPSRDLTSFVSQESEHGHRFAPQIPLTGSISFPFDIKRRRLVLGDSEFQTDTEAASVKLEEATNRETRGLKSSVIRKDIPFPSKLQAIRVDDTSAWKDWYTDGFTSIQQTACRTIAKEWIKAIHPKKQSTHPYNGKMPRCEGASPDPERTRPPYWPPHVRHKEPDHIDKTDRTTLLVHLLMHTPQDEIVPDKAKSERSFTARDLLTALQKKQDEGVSTKWRIIEELVNAREAVENYEAGGIDGDAILHVPDWGEVLRVASSRKKVNGGFQVAHHIEEEGECGFEENQVQDDESMVTDSTEAHHIPQTFQDALFAGDQGKNLQFLLPSRDGQEISAQQNSTTIQRQPNHASFRNVSINYPKPLLSQDTNRASGTLAHQENSQDDLLSFSRTDWRNDRHVKPNALRGFESISPFPRSQGIVDSNPYGANQSLGQLTLNHEMISNTSYGGDENYSYNMNQPAGDGYDFRQLDQYQQLGYNQQYDMGRNFDGT